MKNERTEFGSYSRLKKILSSAALCAMMTTNLAGAATYDVSTVAAKGIGDGLGTSDFNSIVDTLKGWVLDDQDTNDGADDTATFAGDICNGSGDCLSDAINSSAGKFVDGTTAADAVFSGGNVGIGTDSPRSALEVHGTSGILLDNGTASGYGFVGSQDNMHISQNTYFDNSVWKALGHPSGKASVFQSNLASNIAFQVSSDDSGTLNAGDSVTQTTNLVVTTDGNVGIGTTAPTEKLDVDGNVKANDFLDANGNSIIRNAKTETYTSITGESGDWFPLFTVGDGGLGATVTATLRTYAHNTVTFVATRGYGPSNMGRINVLNSTVNQNGDYAVVSALRMLQDGSVEAQLIWSSTPSVNIGIQIIGSDNTPDLVTSLANSTSSSIPIDSVVLSNGLMRAGGSIVAKNRIGIGTTSPDAKLDIKSSSPSFVIMDRTSDASIEDKFTIGVGQAGGGDDIMSINSDSTPGIIHFGKSGNVGVGTPIPTEKLEVSGTAKFTDIKVEAQSEKGTCDAANDGKLTYESAPGVEGVFYGCKKRADDTYTWVNLQVFGE